LDWLAPSPGRCGDSFDSLPGGSRLGNEYGLPKRSQSSVTEGRDNRGTAAAIHSAAARALDTMTLLGVVFSDDDAT
jgi:hypothetical protein